MPISVPQIPADTLDGILASIRALTLPSKAVIDGAEAASESGRTFDMMAS